MASNRRVLDRVRPEFRTQRRRGREDRCSKEKILRDLCGFAFTYSGLRISKALVSSGIAYDTKGEPQKALDAWQRVRTAGSRCAPLSEWIELEERIYGP